MDPLSMASGYRSSEPAKAAKAARNDGYAKAETVECGVKCVGGSWWALSSGASQLAAWLEHMARKVCVPMQVLQIASDMVVPP